ncbi:caspase family protein [Streptomyces sp. NPDC047123]|uniref:HD domain-containing protein n=1 Tax=Streptomyces sp. NPDC047123 TaxID=3155622 RepID=UPI003403314F
MSQHRALLIGASDYDEPRIDKLPFIEDDLLLMRQVLMGRGFQAVEIVDSKRGTIPSVVHAQVRGFLRNAKPDDTLWILLSGHGFHFEGRDYLIPEDATYDVEPFSDSCIEIGWRRELEESRAGHVVFLVDACREGVQRDTKAGPPGMRNWARREIAASLRRRVAYVYGCSASQQSLFVHKSEKPLPHAPDTGIPPGTSFSLFSRAICDVVTENPHAMRLQEFAEKTQARVDVLHRAYKRDRTPQQLKIVSELKAGEQDFPLLPGPDRRAAEHPWVRAAVRHRIWQRTRPGPARDVLHELCSTLASRLAADYESTAPVLRDDPWHDADLAQRTLERLDFLVARLGEDIELSPTEAALAVLLPLVSQTFWRQEAERRIGVLAEYGPAPGPEQDPLRKFTQGFPRIKRRLRSLEQAGEADGATQRIRWWLFHRWLIQQPEVYAESFKALVEDAALGFDHPRWVMEALAGRRLMRHLMEHRATPCALPRAEALHESDAIAASTGDEHEVREPLVAVLHKVAHAMAVDPIDLPEIVVEHLGISDSVNLDELRSTVRNSTWRTSGMGRSLNAVCSHPAVQIALREHAARVDGLLREINGSDRPALAPLAGLPPYADGSLVRPRGKTSQQLSDGIRFQLAEDRVQELLMGEELYGERDLAVREIYQNALDAVRYADRRREFLRRTGHPAPPWEGRIEFTQGVGDDGRSYLECRDNGIGMGIRELRDVFSQGGARFVDLPEYVEEQAAWAELPDPKIELHPNSRFGIGVLSYFMLANEIVVRTCRMGRDGRPGDLFQVSIAGPGNLFRVENLGPGTESGTTVRLLLTQVGKPVSCVEVLQRVLWVAPYRTTAEHGARRHTWEPGEPSPAGMELVQSSYDHRIAVKRRSRVIVPSSDPDLWWVDGAGWLLADGLWAAPRVMSNMHGFVINLYGEQQPELSVSRSTIQDFDWDYVKERFSAAVPSLFDAGPGLANPRWLSRLCGVAVDLADRVAAEAREHDVPWALSADTTARFADVGFFPLDAALLPLLSDGPKDRATAHSSSYLRNVPPAVLRWRLLALYRAGLGSPLATVAPEGPDPSARPSDLVLVSKGGVFEQWDSDFDTWQQGPIGASTYGDHASPFLIDSGAPSLRLLFPWWDPDEPFGAAEVFTRVDHTGIPAVDVVARLTALGYRVDPLGACAAVAPEDLPLLRTLDAYLEWLTPGQTLSAAQICVSAARAEWSTDLAAQRLSELGFTVPPGVPHRETWTDEEMAVIRSLRIARSDASTRLDPDDGLSPAQLASVACASGLSARHTAEVLARLGFPVEPPDWELTDDDRSLMSFADAQPWPDQPVPWIYVVAAGRRFGSVEGAADRLRALGFDVPGPRPEEEQLSSDDVEFLSTLLDRAPDGVPLSLVDIAEVARGADVSLVEATERLTRLGYACAPDPATLGALRPQDTEMLRYAFGVPHPDKGTIPLPDQYAAALHTGRTGPDIGDMQEALRRLGYDLAPVTPEWSRERTVEQDLVEALQPDGSAPLVTANARLSLSTLVTVAARVSLPFHDVARKASELGLRHDAEGWFTPSG